VQIKEKKQLAYESLDTESETDLDRRQDDQEELTSSREKAEEPDSLLIH